MEQVRLCAVWLFHEPHTGLHDCLILLLLCFRKRMSVGRVVVDEDEGEESIGFGGGREGGLFHTWKETP